MTERDGVQRVEVYVPQTSAAVLMETLSALATKQGLGITIDKLGGESWGVVIEKGLQSYNPELVEWVTSEENSPPVPVITHRKLQIFAEERDFKQAVPTRVIGAVSRHLEGGKEYLHHRIDPPMAETVGFRAKLFGNLVSRLGEEEVRNIGEVSLRFLQLVNENLWVPAENQQDPT